MRVVNSTFGFDRKYYVRESFRYYQISETYTSLSKGDHRVMSSKNFSSSAYQRKKPDINDFLYGSSSSARTRTAASGLSAKDKTHRYEKHGTSSYSRTSENLRLDKNDYNHQNSSTSEPNDSGSTPYGQTQNSSHTEMPLSSVTTNHEPIDSRLTYRHTGDSHQVDRLLTVLKELKNIDVDSIECEFKEKPISLPGLAQHKLEEENKVLKDTVEDLTTKYNEAITMNEELTTKAKQLIKDAKRKVAEEREAAIQKLKSQVAELENDNRELRTEKDSALSRLSKEMGTRLSDNNPGIADLSDPNRSTKLAEKYLSLYDNDWTDALESLTLSHIDEEAGVRFLLEIIKHVYTFCTRAKTELLGDLEEKLAHPISKSFEKTLDNTEDKQIRQLLENCLKLKATAQISSLQKSYDQMSSTNKPRYADRLPEYVNKCVEICWLMNIQNPPLVFAEPQTGGETVNKDLYKEYTRQGNIVSYIVWLPLLIEKDGAVLQKGVVQPVANAVKSRSEPKKAWTEEKDKYRSRTETDDERFQHLLKDVKSKDTSNDLLDKSKQTSYSKSEYGNERYKYRNELTDYQKGEERYTSYQPKVDVTENKVDDFFQDARTHAYSSNIPSSDTRLMPSTRPYSELYSDSNPASALTYNPTHSSTLQQRSSRYQNELHGRTRSNEKAYLDPQTTDVSKYRLGTGGSTRNTDNETNFSFFNHANAEIFTYGSHTYALHKKQLYVYDTAKGRWRVTRENPGESYA